jgi:predicted nucleotidyltransferase
MDLEGVLRRIASELTSAGVPFALIGGLAVSVRTEPRFTRDADLAVAVATDAEAETLVHRLGGRGFIAHTVLEQHAMGRLATVRLSESSESSGPVVDLLFASSGIEAELAAEAELLELLPQLVIPVARTGHLIALKVLSRDDERRPQDLVDLRALVRSAAPEELERARHAVKLITQRGFHRGLDLMAGLRDLT